MPLVRSERMRRHLTGTSFDRPKQSDSCERLIRNAKFIEEGHLEDLIHRTKESLKVILS
jgi:hypothetical protein